MGSVDAIDGTARPWQSQGMTTFITKRIYEDASPDDGWRVLVDRLWPRGVSKEKADLDEWAKDLAPSTDLRKWFGHKPERFEEFAKRYVAELEANPDAPDTIAGWREHDKVTLLYGARDETHNEAVVLKDYLDSHSPSRH